MPNEGLLIDLARTMARVEERVDHVNDKIGDLKEFVSDKIDEVTSRVETLSRDVVSLRERGDAMDGTVAALQREALERKKHRAKILKVGSTIFTAVAVAAVLTILGLK